MKRKIDIYILDNYLDDICEEIHEDGTLVTLCALLFLCFKERSNMKRYSIKILFR